MNKEKVGLVTEVEKEDLSVLYERKLALSELLPTVRSNMLSEEEQDNLYEKIVKDVGKTKRETEHWWNTMSKKYSWKSHLNGRWTIDFLTNEIFLLYAETDANKDIEKAV